MKEGLWHRVLKDKYMSFVSIARWLRMVDTTKEKGSQAWKYLLKSLHLLLHWIAWSPGNGQSILIGKDCILGMGQSAILSEELIEAINRKGIYYLFQAKALAQVGRITSNWISSVDLDLSGQLQEEWQAYRCALINNGITLQEKSDLLKWTGGNMSGQVTVRNIYLAAEKQKWIYKTGGWRKAIWDWDCPLKIKLFFWLLMENKILVVGDPSTQRIYRPKCM
jgi:hypothetical protein